MLKKILPIHIYSQGKWTPNFKGPYVVRKIFSRGALILSTMDSEDLASHVKIDTVKKYFA